MPVSWEGNDQLQFLPILYLQGVLCVMCLAAPSSTTHFLFLIHDAILYIKVSILYEVYTSICNKALNLHICLSQIRSAEMAVVCMPTAGPRLPIGAQFKWFVNFSLYASPVSTLTPIYSVLTQIHRLCTHQLCFAHR